MSNSRSEEEVKQYQIDKMGKELLSLYHALWKELAWLNFKWGEFVELFGTEPSRIEILNKSAGHFFWIVRDILLEDTLMNISRLTDPPKSRGRENLTIQKLPDFIRDEVFKEQLTKIKAVAVEKADFCRDRRNWRIAHIDLGLAMKTSMVPLQSVNRKKVIEAMSTLSDVLNCPRLN